MTECDRIIRIQDKDSRFVIEWKENYKEKMLNYLKDLSIFKEEDESPLEMNQQKVNQWVEKWYRQENIGEEEYEWILCSKRDLAKLMQT